ncbi:MAG: glycosyltransferase family 39 protein [Acidimicrobiales bacterium]
MAVLTAPAVQRPVRRPDRSPGGKRCCSCWPLFLAIGLHQAGCATPRRSTRASTCPAASPRSCGATCMNRSTRRCQGADALPALLAHPIVPDTEAWERGDWFDWSDDFIAANEAAGRLDDVLLYARAVVLLEALACAGLLYLLARRWFGGDGGLLVAAAWLLTPYVVGIGHVAMIDLPFVLASLGVALLLARWSDRPTTARLLALGAALAGALASRHTALVLAALAVALVAERRRGEPKGGAA